MEVGVEISQKIRSAIKAKLMELGCYVDDELPDYIMVMVANKRTRAQMASDLSLFLAANTDPFTAWLHGLLVKLQAINSDPNKDQPGNATDKGEKSKGSKKKEKSKGKEKKSKKIETKKKEDLNKIVPQNDNNEGLQDSAIPVSINQDNISVQLNASSSSTDTIKPKRQEVEEVSLSLGQDKTVEIESEDRPTEESEKIDDVEDVRQLLVETTSDALAVELETTEREVVEGSKTVKTKVDKISKKVQPNEHIVNVASVRRLSRSKSHSPERPTVSRKRKTPISVVNAVVRTSDSDDEYDPSNPSVGTVASVVKVTQRKSSIAPALQANRALLMKAMSEAERSIAVKRRVAVTKPMSRDDSPGETYSPKRKCLYKEESPPPYIPSKKVLSSGHASTAQESARSNLSQNDARHILNKEERKELISRSRRKELLQTIGIQREEKVLVRSTSSPERKRTKSQEDSVSLIHKREVRDESKSGEIKNFQITTRVVSAPGSTPEKKRQHVSPSPRQKQESFDTSLQQTTSTCSGKVLPIGKSASVVAKSAETRSGKPVAATARDTRVSNKGRPRVSVGGLGVSRMGKEAVMKQCEAAVHSVKAAQTLERLKARKSPDSRVVFHDEEVKIEHGEEEELDLKMEVGDSGDCTELIPRKLDESMLTRKESSNEDDTEDLAEMISNDPEPEYLDVSQNDEFTLDLDDDDIIKVVGDLSDEPIEKLRSDKHEEPKKGTRFIVTLDGVDGRDFEEEGKTYEKFKHPTTGHADVRLRSLSAGDKEDVVLDVLAAQAGSGTHPVLQSTQLAQTSLQYALPIPAKITPPKIQPFSISLKDSDDEHEGKIETKSYVTPVPQQVSPEGLTALKRAKLTERCKFWPACAVGTACEFHHPTTHCKTFPNCKFGDKCLFIHPNCRFDSKCARPDCPYTHTSKRPGMSGMASHIIAIPQPHMVFQPSISKAYSASYGGGHWHPASTSGQTVCRFYPNCHNVNCAFLHPKPCHFGLACHTPDCPFYHPPVPAKDKLKWQASQTSNSSVVHKFKDVSPVLDQANIFSTSSGLVKPVEGSVSSTSQ